MLTKAFDKSARLKPVNEPPDTDGLHFENRSQFVLGKPRRRVHPGENDPLGTRHPPRPRPLIEAGPEQAGHVVEQKQEIPVKWLHVWSSLAA